MAKQTRERLETQLRESVSRLLSDDAEYKSPRTEMLDRIRSQDRHAYLFGGTLRDIMVRSPYEPTRDIDIVVADTTTDELQDEFHDYVTARTRFGGLQLSVEGWAFDLWPLADTWAIREFPIFLHSDPSELPKTAFMTIEAVAVPLQAKRGKPRQVFERGFYESIAKQEIELNFDATPCPELNCLRALVSARRLRYSIGPRLVRFIVDHTRDVEVDELVELQRRRYGREYFPQDELYRIMQSLRRWTRQNPGEAFPFLRVEQMWLPGLESECRRLSRAIKASVHAIQRQFCDLRLQLSPDAMQREISRQLWLPGFRDELREEQDQIARSLRCVRTKCESLSAYGSVARQYKRSLQAAVEVVENCTAQGRIQDSIEIATQLRQSVDCVADEVARVSALHDDVLLCFFDQTRPEPDWQKDSATCSEPAHGDRSLCSNTNFPD